MPKPSITPLETLGLPQRSLCTLARHSIDSVEALGRLKPEQIRRMLPYCDALYALTRFKHWHDRVYPAPAPFR